MLELSIYKITLHPTEDNKYRHQEFNNGCDWLRKSVNKLYIQNRESLMKFGDILSLFHNHDEKANNTICRYPLIQFQRVESEYFIVGINDGALLLGELLKGQEFMIQNDEPFSMIIDRPIKFHFETTILNYQCAYKLTNWLPLSSENYKIFGDIKSLSEKILFLEERLRDHILKYFARYLSLDISPKEVIIFITDIDSFNNKKKTVIENKHEHIFQPFTIKFSANLKLPKHICIGNKCVYGFGFLETAP